MQWEGFAVREAAGQPAATARARKSGPMPQEIRMAGRRSHAQLQIRNCKRLPDFLSIGRGSRDARLDRPADGPIPARLPGGPRARTSCQAPVASSSSATSGQMTRAMSLEPGRLRLRQCDQRVRPGERQHQRRLRRWQLLPRRADCLQFRQPRDGVSSAALRAFHALDRHLAPCRGSRVVSRVYRRGWRVAQGGELPAVELVELLEKIDRHHLSPV